MLEKERWADQNEHRVVVRIKRIKVNLVGTSVIKIDSFHPVPSAYPGDSPSLATSRCDRAPASSYGVATDSVPLLQNEGTDQWSESVEETKSCIYPRGVFPKCIPLQKSATMPWRYR